MQACCSVLLADVFSGVFEKYFLLYFNIFFLRPETGSGHTICVWWWLHEDPGIAHLSADYVWIRWAGNQNCTLVWVISLGCRCCFPQCPLWTPHEEIIKWYNWEDLWEIVWPYLLWRAQDRENKEKKNPKNKTLILFPLADTLYNASAFFPC